MSGFEVAGFIVALYPVIVDGVRTYRLAKSGQPLEWLIKEILAEQLIFRNHLVNLLMPIVPGEALSDMLNPKSDKHTHWRDPALRSAVDEAMGVLTTTYLLTTLEDIHKELCEIKSSLSYATRLEEVSQGPSSRVLSNSLC